jgi:catechol 2,3-dioxygenase-like lactoylglutathione lyase family enzyme
MLVVADAAASRDWYVEALDASVYGKYGGIPVVLDLRGSWLLLVTGGAPSRASRPTEGVAEPSQGCPRPGPQAGPDGGSGSGLCLSTAGTADEPCQEHHDEHRGHREEGDEACLAGDGEPFVLGVGEDL